MAGVEVSADYGGRLLTLQCGKVAKQTDGSVFCRYGDTVVLVTVVSSQDLKEDQDFFPLTVDYIEKYFAAGRIPGGFFKREARPSETATLTARLIDRPIRPLFPEDYMYETNVVATVLSTDGENDPGIVASIGASVAIHISDIPWNGPVACARIGCVDGKFILNPSASQFALSNVDFLVSGVKDGVVMVEGSADEVSEKHMMDAIQFAHDGMLPIFKLQDELRSKIGKAKRTYHTPARDESLKKNLRDELSSGFKKSFSISEKLARYEALSLLKENAVKKFGVESPSTKEEGTKNKLVKLYFEELKAAYAREITLGNQARIDGRKYHEIRPIQCEVGLLPRTHGSGLFTRGETQVLSTVTLGTSDDEQKIDSISGVYQKTFMLHYNFPPFSVGEAKPMRAPGRREIGHGHLAERALSRMLPNKEVFPYTVRIVAEVLESNGSSSMASVCSGTLALLDAGVPIKKLVAGVAMGLIQEGNRTAVLSDILGDEDHLGDMDFKVCGTADGITAFQMDLKIANISPQIMEKALDQAKEGRLHILNCMKETMSEPRAERSPYAPRIFVMKIKPSKVREVIGSGGKVIRGIIEQTGVKIDIEDDGSIHVASVDEAAAKKAIAIIERIIEEAEPGKVYEGKVTRVVDFGAFIEIIPGTEGLVHISELEHFRVRRVDDVLKEGDMVSVKCLEVDPQGKIRLSRKALLPKDSSNASRPPEGDSPGNERSGGENYRDRGPRRDGRSDGRPPFRERDRGDRNRPPRGESQGSSFPRFSRFDKESDDDS